MLELFGAQRCPHTQELREWLDWQHHEYVEYDVEHDTAARRRLAELSRGLRSVPVLVEDNKIIQVGWQGRSCMIDSMD